VTVKSYYVSLTQGQQVLDNIGNVFRVSVPLLLYFGIMWLSTFLFLFKMGSSYEFTVTQASGQTGRAHS
jgi:arsenite transporter